MAESREKKYLNTANNDYISNNNKKKQVYDMLKSAVMVEYRSMVKKTRSGGGGGDKIMQHVHTMESMISSVVQHSGQGWENIIEPLVVFGLVLADTGGLKGGMLCMSTGPFTILDFWPQHEVWRAASHI